MIEEKNIITIMARFFRRLSGALKKDKSGSVPSSPSTGHGSVTDLGFGTVINERYRLEAEIGRGGMAIVYRARDLLQNRDVAVKIINLHMANALTRGQFLREVQIHARMHHPHIVAVHEAGMMDAGAPELSPYLVMEWVQGLRLEKMSGLTYARILDIGKQICDALEYIHQQGIVYRDLKPANILLERRGFQYFVKLMDFGLARPRGMAYAPGESSLAGSFFYLAPELIAGGPADIPSDLYALGITLYELITGHVPFSSFDEQTVLSQHLEEPVIPPSQSRPDLPPALEAIILRLLAKHPTERFASAQEVHESLEQVRIGLQSDVSPGNLPPVSTNFPGKEDEIAQVRHLLESSPFVTILEEGETLAFAVGTQLADQFTDGVWCVELKSTNDPGLVPERVASILGVEVDRHRSLTVSLIEYLREKNLLLILNHCDHVLGACAQLAETILSTCSDVRILATSQHPLGVPSEAGYRASP